jgi:hypothetical protein
MRSTPSARVSGAPRLPLALAASLFALGALVSSARAETMPTRDTMDSGADMLSAFARYEMDDAVIDLFDAETGVKLSAKSVAAVADSSPFDDQNDFDLGLFVAASDGKFEPGQTVNVSVCDFGNPSKCVKAEPYKGAPESYECGASDELLPETDFRCVDDRRRNRRGRRPEPHRDGRRARRKCGVRRDRDRGRSIGRRRPDRHGRGRRHRGRRHLRRYHLFRRDLRR